MRVLVVGQTPPPYGGQAIAIESFVKGRYRDLELVHVRMGFSSDMSEIGRFRLRKVGHLLGLIVQILWKRATTGATVLYYPPAGADVIPVLRDIAILLSTRWAFERTVFHFHAGGLSNVYPRLPRVAQPLFRRAYARPDLAITPSSLNPEDGAFLHAVRQAVVPNGVPDLDQTLRPPKQSANERPVVLYVGMLSESKGVGDLLEAFATVKRGGVACELQLMGQFAPVEFKGEIEARIRTLGLDNDVRLLGVRTGRAKDETFSSADVFCYPTRFESETFGIVVVEAMRSGLPVVATRWRGVPSLVDDGESGFLVPVHDIDAMADRLAFLLGDSEARARLGSRGRQRYLERFTEEQFRNTMEHELVTLP